MPELDPNNLPKSSAPQAVEVIRATLDAATGTRAKLQQSCKVGVDSVLRDAMELKIIESAMPCIRIMYRPQQFRMPNVGGTVNQTIALSLFFLYSTGKHGGTVLPLSFTDSRDRHILWNLEYLKEMQVLPNNTIGIDSSLFYDNSAPPKKYWWIPEQEINVEHEVPFDVFGVNVPIPASSGFACSRVDMVIMAMTHATFT